MLRSQGRLREAIRHYVKWIEKLPGANQLRINAMNCAIEAEEFEQATKWGEAGIKEQPEDEPLGLAMARTYAANGYHQKSIKQINSILQRYPSNGKAWLELGVVQHQTGDQKAALKSYEHAQKLVPNEIKAFSNQLLILKDQGKWEEIDNILKKLPKNISEKTRYKQQRQIYI